MNKQPDSEYLKELAMVMSTALGRRVMWAILAKANVMTPSYTGDMGSTFFNEGRRSVGLSLWADLEAASFDKLLMMQREAMEQNNDNGNDNSGTTTTDRIKSALGLDTSGTSASAAAASSTAQDTAGWFGEDPALDDI